MNKIFGQQITFDESTDDKKVRSNIWKIQKLALRTWIYGFVNVLLLFVSAFNWMSFVVLFILSIIFYILIWFKHKADSAELVEEINSLVGKYAYDGNSVQAYQDDITNDTDMIVAMRSITAVYIFGFFIVSLLSIFVFISSMIFLPFMFNCTFFLLPWVYMGIILTKKAESGAREDFNMSLNGGLKKLFQTDTIRTSSSQG